MNLHYKEMLVNFFFYLNYFKKFLWSLFSTQEKTIDSKKAIQREPLMVRQRLLKRKGLLVA